MSERIVSALTIAIFAVIILCTAAYVYASDTSPWQLMAASDETHTLAYWAVVVDESTTITAWQTEQPDGHRYGYYLVWHNCANGLRAFAEHALSGELVGGIGCDGEGIRASFVEHLPAIPAQMETWLTATSTVVR